MRIDRLAGSLLCSLLLLVGLSSLTSAAEPSTAEFFRTRIEPALKQHCYQCHSGRTDPPKGGLRLDTPQALLAGGESGKVVVPGEPEASVLIQALQHDGLEMPPKGQLAAAQIEAFRNWIKAGAIDPRTPGEVARHWAFEPIRDVPPPAITSAWVRNTIDQFVLSRLSSQQIQPSDEATPVTLLRRLHLDLIGLPPSRAELAAYLEDPPSQRYERAVERLLSSPHYGERWGRHWLDMARYADSNGYEADRVRPNAWRWRDWVLQALNQDMAFDEFTIQQLAGDLVPDSSLQTVLATGFHRNTLVNTEGGVDREEDRVKRTVDRTNTVAKVWLGLTLECCQCHSHKYDPISQREYYQFYAFFNSLAEPMLPSFNEMEEERYRRRRREFDLAHQAYWDALRDYRSEAMQAWEKQLSIAGPYWRVLTPTHLSTSAGTELRPGLHGSLDAYGANRSSEIYTIGALVESQSVSAIRLEALPDARLGAGGPGLAGNGNFVLTAFRVFVRQGGEDQRRERLEIARAHADFSQGGHEIAATLADSAESGWAIYPEVGKRHTAVFELAKPIACGPGTTLTFELEHAMWKDHNLGRFRLSVTDIPRPVPLELSDSDVGEILAKPRSVWTGQDVLRLVRKFDFQEEAVEKLIAAEEEHRKQAPLPPVMTEVARVVKEEPTRRPTHIHLRGDFLSKGEAVDPGTPRVLPPLKTRNDLGDRLDLARWLTQRDNPLPARVLVNRVWQHHFGRGLVPTDDDFGTQGEFPSHPELLDWLAFQFQAGGWNMRQLHRSIVLSATYRQSSAARPELLELDPYNTLLARQNRLRVEAEIVRDLALAVSGLLQTQIGGPSVRPPQPADLAALGFQGNVTWPVSFGRDRYRRGIYTFFQRTVPYPMLIEFDAPDSNKACTRRERSTSSLQALTIWNDPVFLECARAFAARIILEAGAPSLESRLQNAIQLAFGREPDAVELKILRRYWRERVEFFAADEEAAQHMIRDNLPAEGKQSERAAWVSVARLILNLDEFITRE